MKKKNKKNKKKKLVWWVHQGGGVYIGGGIRYPADDTFRKGNKVIEVKSTIDAHCDRIPERVKTPAELRKIPGVNKRSVVVKSIKPDIDIVE